MLLPTSHVQLGHGTASDLAAINQELERLRQGRTYFMEWVDEYDDIALLRKRRQGEPLPFEVGDMLNRDRLLRDTIIQEHGHRLTADAEREAIRARLDDIEGRG